ncbi:outer-membrane lipoprotein carrier protein LolA [Candidatus Pelagibacter sp.]|nr:outer-membrane lipoprotein carrier protein LolA [Candidatus Pelagibacter sp.]
MKKIIIIFFFFFLFPLEASIKQKIIVNLENTKNFSFNFKQTIDKKTEKGNCVIEYPKKIFCEYDNINKKIIVSNGKSLVIKNRSNNISYLYPLRKTPLELILDKKYLIKKIKKSISRTIDNKYINFTLIEKDNKINIFFDIKTLNLIGWQTEDIYQNLVVTFISSISYNQKIDKKKFILPELN